MPFKIRREEANEVPLGTAGQMLRSEKIKLGLAKIPIDD